jgi:hypothetical protein
LHCGTPATAIAAVLALAWSPAGSAQTNEIVTSFNGYATLGAAWSDNRTADYIANALNYEGPGRSRATDPGVDTRFGFQAATHFNDRWSSVVQVVVERQFDGDFKPELEWANISYQLTPGLSLRAGRTALDTFLVSDHRKVSYALPWLRPPTELYQLVSISNSDGLDATYQRRVADSLITVSALYGRNTMDELDGFLEAPNLWGIFPRLELGNLVIKGSYTSYKLVYGQLGDLWSAFEAFGPAGRDVVERYRSSKRRSVFTALAFDYDARDWFVMGEWGRSDTHSDFGARSGWYLSAGRRVGQWSPYLTFAKAQGGHSSVSGLQADAFPTGLRDSIAAVNNFLLESQDTLAPRQQTISLGTRWNFAPGFSAKLQFDFIDPERGSSGTFTNLLQPRDPGDTRILSATVDMVF